MVCRALEAGRCKDMAEPTCLACHLASALGVILAGLEHPPSAAGYLQILSEYYRERRVYCLAGSLHERCRFRGEMPGLVKTA
jgi:hypothetical protein